MPANLYVHFPFCRRKCSYCALYSRTGSTEEERNRHVRRLADEFAAAVSAGECGTLETVYFGGGSPALCDLRPLSMLSEWLGENAEFTVELHPLDVTDEKLRELRGLGVNRISMGVQSFRDPVLAAMGRGYAAEAALRAFGTAARHFGNAGIDLIAGYPGDTLEAEDWRRWLVRYAEAGMRHCSVYSLQNERGLAGVPGDGAVLDCLRQVSGVLREVGLERYEISNYASPGFECRHNLAVWRGEDYWGLGEGACGRIGLARTAGRRTGIATETVDRELDRKERTIFRLRTREGLDAAEFPEWREPLDRHVRCGLLTKSGTVYRLTARGTEVCDAILAELV